MSQIENQEQYEFNFIYKQKEVEEEEVGIIEFFSNNIVIQGAIKYKYSDFIVNEIQEDSIILFPNKQEQMLYKEQQKKEIPKYSEQQIQKSRDEIINERKIRKNEKFLQKIKTNLPENYSILSNDEKESFNDQQFSQLQAFLNNILLNGDMQNQSIELLSHENKNIRASQHSLLKKWLPQQYFHSNTVKGTQNLIQIHFSKQQNKIKESYKSYLPDEKFLRFIMTKENIDSFSACNILAYNLGKKHKNFGLAGSKDKRGITTQRVSIFGARKEQIESFDFLQKLAIKHKIFLSDFCYSPQSIKLGELMGNRFSVAIRFVKVQQNEIQFNINNLKTHGFINYFGLQRFGSSNVHTHDIGREIMKRNWKNVFDMIFFQYEDDKLKEAKIEFLKSLNLKNFLKKFNAKMKFERFLAEGFVKGSFQNAIMNIPKNQRELYAHGYQSYLWNISASKRIQQYGNSIVIGDLVEYSKQENNNKIQYNEENELEILSCEEDLTFNSKIEIVTQENIMNYSLKDVLIPIYGSQLDLPEDSNIKDIIYAQLTKDQISLNDFIKSSHDFHLYGGYRKLVEFPLDLEWKELTFKNATQQLLTPFYNLEQDYSNSDGEYKAIALKFSLTKASYATMCLREFMHFSTSLKNQELFLKLQNL